MSSMGRLRLAGWHGISEKRVEVIGETPKRYRIRAIERTRLAGPGRWLEPGAVALVPKTAVLDNCEVCDGHNGGVPGNENIIDGKVVCDYCDAAQRPR